MTPQDRAKQAAAEAALDQVQPGMRLGLGSGSTALRFVALLGERVAQGLEIQAVASSAGTAAAAERAGILLTTLEDLPELDLTIDGADEIDAAGRMIKGGGACLLWEKIVATASARMLCIADDSKLVAGLGRFPLPVEINRFGHRATRRLIAETLERLGYPAVSLRLRGGEAEPLLTDGGHWILDLHLGSIPEPEALAAALLGIAGVVETGLFLGIADAALLGRADGTVLTRRFRD